MWITVLDPLLENNESKWDATVANCFFFLYIAEKWHSCEIGTVDMKTYTSVQSNDANGLLN